MVAVVVVARAQRISLGKDVSAGEVVILFSEDVVLDGVMLALLAVFVPIDALFAVVLVVEAPVEDAIFASQLHNKGENLLMIVGEECRKREEGEIGQKLVIYNVNKEECSVCAVLTKFTRRSASLSSIHQAGARLPH